MSQISPIGILSYPNLFTARPNQMNPNAEPQYTCVLVFPPDAQDSDAFKAMKAEAGRAAREKWGTNMPGNLRNPIRDVSDNDNMARQFPAGSVYVNFKSKNKPAVIDGHKNDIEVPSDVFAGMHARVSYGAYAYDVNGNRGVAFGLNNVQITKMKDVERIDGRANAKDEFDATESASSASATADADEDVFA